MTKIFSSSISFFLGTLLFVGCNNADTTKNIATEPPVSEAPEYFNLRPKLEKEYGYTHAVRIGDDL